MLFSLDLLVVAEDRDGIWIHSLDGMPPRPGGGVFVALPFDEGAGVVTCNGERGGGEARRVTDLSTGDQLLEDHS